MIRVFLIDDHEIVRAGIAQIIDAEHDLEVVGEAVGMRGALGRISATMPDVAVVDVRLPDGNGIDLCRSIRTMHPQVVCLILTAFDDDAGNEAAVLAGASGYIMKTIRGTTLIDSIRRAAVGESLISHAVVAQVHQRLADRAGGSVSGAEPDLTLRERQALRLITEGLTNRQIGERLGIAEKTVKNYVSGLLAKLGMERRTQVAVYGATLRGKDGQHN